MAEVDFSNAIIEPALTDTPTVNANLSLDSNLLYSVSSPSTSIVNSGATRLRLVNASKQMVYIYQGVFTTSGTEFLIHTSSNATAGWKVSNISFNSGDTYVFQINATLTCN